MIFSDRAQESFVSIIDQIGLNSIDIFDLSQLASQKYRVALDTTQLNDGMGFIDAEFREIEQLFGQRREAKRQRETNSDSDHELLPEPFAYSSRLVTQTS